MWILLRLFRECKATVTMFVLQESTVYARRRTYDWVRMQKCNEHLQFLLVSVFPLFSFRREARRRKITINFLLKSSLPFSDPFASRWFLLKWILEAHSKVNLPRLMPFYVFSRKAYGKYVRLKNKSQFSLTPRSTFRFYYFQEFSRILG